MKFAFDDNLVESANDVRKKLSDIADEYDRLGDMLSRHETKVIHEQPSNQEDDQKRKSLEEAIKIVDAFIKSASNHTNDQVAHEAPRPYNRSKLVALQVQIDPNSSDDIKARELLHEACGQLSELNKELQQHLSFVNENSTRRTTQQRNKQQVLSNIRRSLEERYRGLLNSSTFKSVFYDAITYPFSNQDIVLGEGAVPLPLPNNDRIAFGESIATTDLSKTPEGDLFVRIPIALRIHTGGSILMDVDDDSDASLLGNPSSIFLNVLHTLQRTQNLDYAAYIDPITFSPLSLGPMSELAFGSHPIISDSPRSLEEMRAFFSSLDSKMICLEDRKARSDKDIAASNVFVFRDYPNAYEESALKMLRKLIFMAEDFGAVVILEKSKKGPNSTNAEALEPIMKHCIYIQNDGGRSFIQTSDFGQIQLTWKPMPDNIHGILSDFADCKTNASDENNRYVSYFEQKPFTEIVKGDRSLQGIPVGILSDGSTVNIDLEKENFATFVVGASRSGKSTLLHTILTGIFLSKHPDDVEIWLIDFKMTEFSRYIRYPLPHIRYIVLDESPELVYDLLDRLTDIMLKRQAIFKKNGWVKLSDAQAAGRYMPALLVVIDEFSVMSNIVSSAVISGKDYKEKLQTLLSKGAALGFRFVFASQGFTQGTRGLSDYSKKQIQQRIAMKTDYAEIKAALDLPSVSDADRRAMENLVPHYALVKATDTYGENRLRKAHVLYFEDETEQHQLLTQCISKYTAGKIYDATDTSSYIDKQIQIFDGNELSDYTGEHRAIKDSINKLLSETFDPSSIYICPGKALRLKSCMPIELVNGYAENILFCVPISKGEAFQSAIATLLRSSEEQDVQVNILAPRTTPLVPNNGTCEMLGAQVYYGATDIESHLHELNQFQSTTSCKKSIEIVLCPELILRRSSVATDFDNRGSEGKQHTATIPTFARNKDKGDSQATSPEETPEPKFGISNKTVDAFEAKRDPASAMERCTAMLGLTPRSKTENRKYDDAGSMLLNLLEHGPKNGIHSMFVVQNHKELRNCGVQLDLFRHRLAFRISQEDARVFMSRTDALATAELFDNCFRYTNGLDSTTYRAYAHHDLGIFSENEPDDSEDYLL